jgi:hypothetical protein
MKLLPGSLFLTILTIMIFTPDIVKDLSIDLSEIQQLMVNSLIDHILNPIEEYAGCKMTVTNGLRTLQDYDRLKEQGYNPSRRSDHFFGLLPLTSGAADTVYEKGDKFTVELFYDLYRRYSKAKDRIILPNADVQVGQMILEVNDTHWIHLSNPRRLFYSKDCPLPGQMFLRSDDNGKTYKTLE